MGIVQFLQAVLLGVVQGITEFLPVSSSGHLLLAQHFMGLDQGAFGLPFDAAVQSGTLLAVVSYFRRDISAMARASLPGSVPSSGADAAEVSSRRRMARLILIATLPAGLAGLLFEDLVAGGLRSPWVVVANLVLVGVLFLVAERVGTKEGRARKLGVAAALAIGVAQACALVPGVSRSGATITTGLFLGLRREEAARFSFLLSIPIISAAALFGLAEALADGMDRAQVLTFATGIAVSAAVGYLAIRFLLRYLSQHSLRAFAYYRFGLAAIVATVLLAAAS